MSNRKRLLRVIGWVKRFIKNSRSVKEQRDVGQLSPEEMADAEVYTTKSSQKEYFKQEYEALQRGSRFSTSSKLTSVSPELDSDGLIRCNDRLKYAEFLPYDARFLLILPRDSPVTRMIVRSYHEENNLSSGANHLLSMLSRRSWVVAGREVIKECTNHCIIYKKNKAVPASQHMAPLPQIRHKCNIRTFSNVGIDFAVPFLTIHGLGKTRNKR